MPQQLSTCRYWALGPGCPNVDAFGTNICPHAHWDTGRLASPFQQHGTCIPWKCFGYCGRGPGCWYEHRHTGVDGLYQGTIELGGPELRIANAANKAGFDTFNHEALFDLIWAAKQAAMTARTNRTGPVSIPQGPLYPDRYRPKGSANNSKKRRKPRTKKPPPNHNIELKYHPIEPLMRKRPHQNGKEDILIDLTISSDDFSPADLSSLPNSIVKRQKTSGAGGGTKEPGPGSVRLSTRQNRKGFPNTAQAAITSGSKRSASQQTALSARQTTRPAPLTTETEITKQLLLVKTKLDDARKSMNTCQSTMKALFDAHYDKFDDDQMMMSLQKLSNFMNKVFDGSRDGAAEIDSAVVLLGEGKDGRADAC